MLNNRIFNAAIFRLHQHICNVEIPDIQKKMGQLILSKNKEDKLMFNILSSQLSELRDIKDLLNDFLNFYKLVQSGNYDPAVISLINETGLNVSEVTRGGIEYKN